MTDQQVPEAVRWLLDQQLLVRAPKREPLPTPISSGGSMATVLVAASDASDLSKSKADFICTGSDDQVTFRRATAATKFTWGTLWLSEGNYECNLDGTAVNIIGMLRGMGRWATTINVTGAGVANEHLIRLLGGSNLADLTIIADSLPITGTVVWSTGTDDGIDNCSIIANTGIGVKMSSNDATVRNSYIYGDRAAMQFPSGFNFTLDSCRLEGSTYGIEDVGFGGPMRISNSFIEGGTGILGGNDLTVVGCEIAGLGTWSVDIPAGAARGRIVANELVGGVRLTGADQYTVALNLIDANQHGILVHDTDDCDLLGNQIDAPGTLVHNTYDGILLSGTSSRNNIQDNRIIGRVAATPKPRWAVNISAAACTSNVWNSNMAGPAGSFGTGVYNNAGTATQGANWTI